MSGTDLTRTSTLTAASFAFIPEEKQRELVAQAEKGRRFETALKTKNIDEVKSVLATYVTDNTPFSDAMIQSIQALPASDFKNAVKGAICDEEDRKAIIKSKAPLHPQPLKDLRSYWQLCHQLGTAPAQEMFFSRYFEEVSNHESYASCMAKHGLLPPFHTIDTLPKSEKIFLLGLSTEYVDRSPDAAYDALNRVKYLIETQGIPVDSAYERYSCRTGRNSTTFCTPLMAAVLTATTGSIRIAKYLLEAGASTAIEYPMWDKDHNENRPSNIVQMLSRILRSVKSPNPILLNSLTALIWCSEITRLDEYKAMALNDVKPREAMEAKLAVINALISPNPLTYPWTADSKEVAVLLINFSVARASTLQDLERIETKYRSLIEHPLSQEDDVTTARFIFDQALNKRRGQLTLLPSAPPATEVIEGGASARISGLEELVDPNPRPCNDLPPKVDPSLCIDKVVPVDSLPPQPASRRVTPELSVAFIEVDIPSVMVEPQLAEILPIPTTAVTIEPEAVAEPVLVEPPVLTVVEAPRSACVVLSDFLGNLRPDALEEQLESGLSRVSGWWSALFQ